MERNKPSTKTLRNMVVRETLGFFKAGYKFVYLDETGFNNNLIPIYNYSKKGEKAFCLCPKQSKNISVLAAISSSGLIGYQAFQGSVKAKDFGSFLITLIQNTPEISNNLAKTVFVFDNARIHHAKLLKPLLSKLTILYNALYSPFLNPIEEVFGIWKHYYRKNYCTGSIDVIKNIALAAKKVSKEKVGNFISHITKFFKSSLEEKDIN